MPTAEEIKHRLEIVTNGLVEQSQMAIENAINSEMAKMRDEELKIAVDELRSQGVRVHRELQQHPNVQRIYAKYETMGLPR